MEGIDPELVRRIKAKMTQPARKQKVKAMLLSLTRQDLQNADKVRNTVATLAHILQEPMKTSEAERLTHWIIAKRIDPRNKLQLLRLWSLFS